MKLYPSADMMTQLYMLQFYSRVLNSAIHKVRAIFCPSATPVDKVPEDAASQSTLH